MLKKLTFLLLCLAWSKLSFAAMIFQDNFDSYTDLAATSTNWSHETTNISLDPTGGVGGSKAIKFAYNGQVYAPFEHSISAANAPEAYIRFKFKVDSGAVGGIKFLKLFGTITNSSWYANWTWNFGPVSSAPSSITTLCYGNGTAYSNDTQVCISPPNGVEGGSDPFIGTISQIATTAFVPSPNIWYEVTTYNKYNTNGSADGEMWLAIDGKKILWVTNCKNRNDGNTRAISRVSFGDYANAYAKINMWLDNVEISTTPFTTTTIAAPILSIKSSTFN